MHSPAPDPAPRFFSLERKLPSLIAGLVAAALIITFALAYYELKRSAVDTASDRLGRVTDQLSELLAPSVAARKGVYTQVAAQPAVVAFATGESDDAAAALAILERLRARSDSALPIQLRTNDGRVLDALAQSTRVGSPIEPPAVQLGMSAPPPDSVVYGPLLVNGDAVTYWASAPVTANGRVVGHIFQQRRVTRGAAAQQLERLIGDDLEIFVGNRTGGPWAALLHEGVTTPAPDSAIILDQPFAYRAPGEPEMLGHATPLEGTPWLVITRMPMSTVLARADDVLRKLGLVGVVLLLLGSLAAWFLSRSVTRPLRELGSAAEAIARGDYSRRTGVTRDDEIGRVARSFDFMAGHVDATHAELERRFEEAQALMSELEETNARANDALTDAESARLEAQHANHAKSSFLATMSHEIRTPINAVIGYTDLLEIEMPGPLTGLQRQYVERIRRSAEHLTSLVNDVLDFAKLESGQMRIQREVQSARIGIDATLAMLQGAAQSKHLDLTIDCVPDITYVGDEQRVQQVLLNLLSNAIKFTSAGGSVRVACDRRDSRALDNNGSHNQWICITVADSGIGISAEQLEAIFEPFVQGASGYTRTHGGTGLGLAISRSLARMMGGDITVESNVGSGSTFTLWLPANA